MADLKKQYDINFRSFIIVSDLSTIHALKIKATKWNISILDSIYISVTTLTVVECAED